MPACRGIVVMDLLVTLTTKQGQAMLNATQAGAGRGWLAAVACLPSRLRTCCRQHALPCGCSPPSTAPLQAQRYTATTTFYSHTHVLALLLPTCPTGLLLPRYPAAACGVGQCHHHPPPRPPNSHIPAYLNGTLLWAPRHPRWLPRHRPRWRKRRQRQWTAPQRQWRQQRTWGCRRG